MTSKHEATLHHYTLPETIVFRGETYTLPPMVAASITNYIVDGTPTGSFTAAVLSGDLADAIKRADEYSMVALPGLVMWLVWNAPAECWGSRGAVKAWHEAGGLALQTKARVSDA